MNVQLYYIHCYTSSTNFEKVQTSTSSLKRVMSATGFPQSNSPLVKLPKVVDSWEDISCVVYRGSQGMPG